MALVPTTDLTRMREGVKRFASGFTPGQKAVTVAAVLGAIILGVLYMSMSGKPTYSVLFSNLQPSDAASITQQLNSDHVPYQLEDGGNTILVPENDVSQARLTAAAAGLPAQSTVGLSLLTKAGLTTSQLAQQADYLQAIQGELEQTIDSISGVSSSQVNVAEAANQTLAISTTKPSGASVLVDLSQGHTLGQNEVQAIVHLVASSVPGLSASQVTVADNSGALLAGPGVNNGGAAQNSETAGYDSSVQAKVESYLQSVFGAGNADVQVDAVLNFNKEKTSTHQLVPSTKSALTSFCTSTKTTKTKYTGNGTPAGGTAGSVTITGSSGQAGTYTQTSQTKSCETGTETSTVTLAPGTVTSQSIAVLVNSKAVPSGTNMSAIKSGVAAAAGLQPSRGDVLSFTEAPFSTVAAKQAAVAAAAAAATSKKAEMGSIEKDGAAALVVFALLFLVWFTARKRRRSVSADSMVETAGPTGMLPAYAPYEIEEYPTGEIPRITPATSQRITPEVEQFIDEQPAEVATVLRGWLREGSPAERIATDA
jgi:flagellar M-ring protein FliF